MPASDGYTFDLNDGVTRTPVRYGNRFGIEIAGDLYVPTNASGKLPALAVSGPFGAVKEQASGLYANEFARRGFVALAFDPSFSGESGGEVRDVASPEIYTEDFSATVDFLGLQEIVDRERIGLQAICGLSGMAITAATADSRIKAVATASMYDMSRSISAATRTATPLGSDARSSTTTAASAGSTRKTAPTLAATTRSLSMMTATSSPATGSSRRRSPRALTRSRRASSTTTAPTAATTRDRSTPTPRGQRRRRRRSSRSRSWRAWTRSPRSWTKRRTCR